MEEGASKGSGGGGGGGGGSDGGGGGGESGGGSGSAHLQLGDEETPPIAHIPTGLDCRITCWDCACCGKAQDPKSAAGCSGCHSVAYCKKSCQKKHWGEHKIKCWEAIKARVVAGDVHKDDAGGEYVLREYLRIARRDFGDKDGRTMESISVYGVFLKSLPPPPPAARKGSGVKSLVLTLSHLCSLSLLAVLPRQLHSAHA